MAKEYATVLVQDGVTLRLDTGAPNGSPEASQYDGLKGYPLVYALNKLDEFGYAPLQGAIDHGQMHTGGANYTLICAREK